MLPELKRIAISPHVESSARDPVATAPRFCGGVVSSDDNDFVATLFSFSERYRSRSTLSFAGCSLHSGKGFFNTATGTSQTVPFFIDPFRQREI
jgi:hypothetical protein